MSIQSDRITNQPLGLSPALAADGACAAVSRKPWATPTVITGEMEDAEGGPAGAADGGPGAGASLS
jgi:hypothetical protein